MSAFGIFALILTAAYIIYFCVVIVRDIATGRKSGNDNPQAETFDTSFMEEQSVEVKETDGGFAVGEDEVIATPIKVTADGNQQESAKDENPSADEIKKNLDESMPEAVEVITDMAMDDIEMMNIMQGRSTNINAANVYVKRISAGNHDSKAGDETPCDHY